MSRATRAQLYITLMDPSQSQDDLKRAAAERRRAKILSRGNDRLARITGSISGPVVSAGANGRSAAPHNPPPATETAILPQFPQPDTHPAPPQQLEQQAGSVVAGPGAQPTVEPAPLAAAFAASLMESQSVQSLSELSECSGLLGSGLRQRKAGTAGTDARWSAYAGAGSAAAKSRRAVSLMPPAPAEALSAAVRLTALMRLAIAFALAGLTAAAALGGCWEPDGDGSQSLPAWQAACSGLAAAWGQQVQRLPPVASLAALDATLLAAAFLLLQSRPSLVRSKAGGSPGLLMRAAAVVPRLADSLALLGAWQRAVASIADDVAAYVLALALLDLAPRVAGGGHS